MLARETVLPGETIVALSQRLLGNPFAWRTLVTLNNLQPPYLTPQSTRGCLSPGDTVYFTAQTTGIIPPVTTSALLARTYKRDLTTHNRDLVLSGGRLLTTAGLDNLKDAVMRRIRTLLGRHPFHPEYGSLAFLHVGRPAEARRLRLLCVDTRRAVLEDPRVLACEVTAAHETDVLSVVVTVTPIAPGDPFVVRVALNRV